MALDHWKEAFLKALRRSGSVSSAAKIIGKDRSTVYYHRERDREFSRAIDGALKLHAEQNVKRVFG